MGKRFVPLESNPDVFNKLIHSLGVSDTLGFSDVFSIDEPELLAMIPRPSYAVILTFPVSDTYEAYRHDQDKDTAADYYEKVSGSKEEKAVWMKQTIGNACGTYAILHALANGVPRDLIVPDSPIDKLLAELQSQTVSERVATLESSDSLEAHHSAVASAGSTEAPAASDQVEHHYVCFAKSAIDGCFYELDGRRKGPVNLGAPTDKSEDALSPIVVAKLQSFIKRESQNEGAAFSILSLGPILD